MEPTKIFIQSYRGSVFDGKWISLPMEEDELKDILHTYDERELFIADSEGFLSFDLNESENLVELNEFLLKLENLDEDSQLKCKFLLETLVVRDRDDALDKYEDVFFYKGMTLLDVARDMVDSGFFGDVNKEIEKYIDFPAIARDLEMEGYVETKEGVFFCN